MIVETFEFLIVELFFFKFEFSNYIFSHCFSLLMYNDKVMQSSNYIWLTWFMWFNYSWLCKFIITDAWIIVTATTMTMITMRWRWSCRWQSRHDHDDHDHDDDIITCRVMTAMTWLQLWQRLWQRRVDDDDVKWIYY